MRYQLFVRKRKVLFKGTQHEQLEALEHRGVLCLGLTDDTLDHAEAEQILRGHFQRFRRLRRLCAVLPENGGAALGRNNGINGVFEHPHLVGNRERQRAAASALTDQNGVTKKAKVELQKVKDEKAKELLNQNLDRVDALLRTNIVAMENTLKKELIKDIADGKLDKEEAKLLVNNVKKNVLNQLSNESLTVLNEGLNDLNGYIGARLEEILVEVKNNNAK